MTLNYKTSSKSQKLVINVTESEIRSVLKDFGLTEKEAQVYIFLVKSGFQKAGRVSEQMKMHKAQVYRILEVLRNRGLVESTLDFPSRFVPISFEAFLDLMIRNRIEETTRLEARKQVLIENLQKLKPQKQQPQQAKFAVIKGRDKIYARISKLVEEAKNEVLEMTDHVGLILSQEAGVFNTRSKKTHLRIVTNVSKENFKFAKILFTKILKSKFTIEERHKDFEAKPQPHFIIKDDNEIIFFLTPTEEDPETKNLDTVLWSNSTEIVLTLKTFFEATWNDAIDLGKRINELETGTIATETIIIKDSKIAQQKFQEAVEKAKKEILAISNSKDITRLIAATLKHNNTEKKLKTQIIVRSDIKNLEIAEKYSRQLQIKYSDAILLSIAIIDKKQLFIFNTKETEQNKTTLHINHTLYTNDSNYVLSLKELLDDLWKKSQDISDVKVRAAMRKNPPTVRKTDAATKVISEMQTKDIGSVVVIDNEKPVGIITEKDAINRLIGLQRDPKKTSAGDIMSSPAITIDSSKTLNEALRVMKKAKIRR
jgi:HTH-type transcriptional regulator, sugar sensing transcriptional regulator